MIKILVAWIKSLGPRKAIEIVLSILRWIAEKTKPTWDDEWVDKITEAYELLKPMVPAKRR